MEYKGLKDPTKRIALKKSIKNHHPDVVIIQESKMENFDALFTKSIWSSKEIGWEFVESISASGAFSKCGMSKITVVEITKGRFSAQLTVIRYAKDAGGFAMYTAHVVTCLVRALIHFRCGIAEISTLLTGLIGRNTRGMRLFNNFIDSANIMELPLQNGRYTWSRP